MVKKKLRKYFFWSLVVLLLCGAVAIFLSIIFNYPPFQRYLIQKIAQASQYDLKTGKIRIEYRDGLGIVAEEFNARKKRSSHFIEAKKIDLSFKYKALLSGQFVPEKIFVQDARIGYPSSRQKKEAVSLDSVSDVNTLIEPLFTHLKIVKLKNAAIFSPWTSYGLKNLDVEIRPSGEDNRHRQVDATGFITEKKASVPFRLAGVVRPRSTDPDAPVIAMDIKLTDVPLAHIPPLKSVRFHGGRASAEMSLSGPNANRLTIAGQIAADNLGFDVVRKGRTKNYSLSQANLDFRGDIGLTGGRIETLAIQTPEAQVGLKLHLDWQNPANLFMDLDIYSHQVALPVFKEIFPTPLVPEWIETRLFPLFSGGSARLDRFRLIGTIDATKKLKLPENAAVLEMRLSLAQLNAFAQDPARVVTGVSGEVVIREGQLLINDVTGKFEGSTLARGQMLWPNLYDKSRRFTLGLKGDFRLEDLKRQGSQPLLPPVVRREIERISAANGQLAADIILSFPGRKALPVLTGEMVLENSRIGHIGLALPLDITTGQINFEQKGAVNVKGTGRWGGSAFEITGTTGLLWQANGIVRQPDLNLAIKADVALTDAFTIRRMGFLPTQWRTALAGINSINGRMGTDLKLRRTKPDPLVQLNGRLTTTNATLSHRQLKLPLEIRKGLMVFNDPKKRRFWIDGTWGRSSFEAQGSAGGPQKTMQAALTAQADANELTRLLYPLARSIVHLNKPLSSVVDIQRTDTRWSFKGEADLDDRIITLPAVTLAPRNKGNRLTFDIDYSPGQLKLNRCIFLGNTSRLILKGSPAQPPHSPLILDIEAAPLNLAELGLRMTGGMGGSDQWIKGRLQGQIKAELPPGQPQKSRVNGALSVDDLHIDNATETSSLKADLRFRDRDIDILHLTFPLGAHTANLNGRLTGWDRWRGQLNLDMDCIDFPRLINRMRADPAGKAENGGNRASLFGWLDNAEIDVAIHANQVNWETIDIGNFVGALRYQNNRLRIDKAIFTAPDSLIKLSGSMAGGQENGVSLLSYFKLDKKPLGAILEGLDLPTEKINGTISLEGGLFLSGRNQTEIIRNLAGKFNFQLNEGSVQNPNVIVKILDFLSIRKIFIRQPPDILKDGFYFESIRGHATIEKGEITTDRLFMKSPVLNAAVRGTYHLPRNHLNFIIGVEPLNTIDQFITKIPIVGHILTGKKKTILVYYFKVRGNPGDVVVKHIPFKNLDDAIVGYFKRLFLTPTRLLTKISDTLEEIGKDIRSGVRQSEETDAVQKGP